MLKIDYPKNQIYNQELKHLLQINPKYVQRKQIFIKKN